MRPKQFTLTHAEPLPASGLRLRYADGQQFEVSLAKIIETHPTLKRLADPEVFRTAQVGDAGVTVTWANDDDLELPASGLRARAIEQAGGVSHEFLWNWMHRNNLTLDGAEAALGVSRRMLAYYRSGERPVPLTVGLACLGWEDVQKSGARFALAA